MALSSEAVRVIPPAGAEARYTGRIAALFFLSGFPALIYQVVWQIALFRIFGVNIESVTIVVAAFMVGLGIGSLTGGQVTRIRGIPALLLLAIIEIGTGIFGLFSLQLFDVVGAATLGASLPLTAVTSLALVLVPTLLMGATLPVLVSELVRRYRSVGHAVGLLYSVNTVGAGAAALLAAPTLLALFGMQVTVWAAVLMNFSVGAGALLVYLRDRAPDAFATTLDGAQAAEEAALPISFRSALLLGFLSGFISLSYELVLYRVFSLATGGMAWSFPVLLGCFLFGIAGGALLVSRSIRGPGGRIATARRVAWMVIGANAVGLLLLPFLVATSSLGLVGSLEILFVPILAAFWGGVLPLLADSGIAADEAAGARVGGLYLANIAGSLLGTLGTGFVLMDYLGMRELMELLVTLGLGTSLVLAFTFPLAGKARAGMVAAVGGICLLLPLHHVLATNAPAAIVLHGPETAARHVIENKSGVIVVSDKGIVFGHGMYDGAFSTTLFPDQNGIIRPYLLSLFHAHPRKVLMIGLSSGSWAQVVAQNPEVESLTVVEINGGYQELVGREASSRSLLTNPRVRLIRDDGRRWLRLHPEERFDAVISNATYNHRGNASNILSQEFDALLQRHLNPDGIFMVNSTGSTRVQHAACGQFRYGTIFHNFLLLSDAPLQPDLKRWQAVLGAMRIDGAPVIEVSRKAEFERLADKLPEEFVACTPNIYEGRPAVTDDNRGAEWKSMFGIM